MRTQPVQLGSLALDRIFRRRLRPRLLRQDPEGGGGRAARGQYDPAGVHCDAADVGGARRTPYDRRGVDPHRRAAGQDARCGLHHRGGDDLLLVRCIPKHGADHLQLERAGRRRGKAHPGGRASAHVDADGAAHGMRPASHPGCRRQRRRRVALPQLMCDGASLSERSATGDRRDGQQAGCGWRSRSGRRFRCRRRGGVQAWATSD
mmetsp:Transcript_75188/g.199919  ORF Transcript_75188/g.199919 Transcript_75188/m.199919 type:complete len:206 (+) Transcript_75188:453-1070(+)